MLYYTMCTFVVTDDMAPCSTVLSVITLVHLCTLYIHGARPLRVKIGTALPNILGMYD